MNPKDFPSGYQFDHDDPPAPNPHFFDYAAEAQKRAELWDKYFDDNSDDSPIRGVAVCLACGALVAKEWDHIDWHEGTE